MLRRVIAQSCGVLAVFELIRPEPISSLVSVLVRLNWPLESSKTADTAVSTDIKRYLVGARQQVSCHKSAL